MLQTILKNYWKLILVFTVVGASASFGLSLAQKPVYVAESRLLIRYIQTQGVDAYAASRAAGKIAHIFSEISKTDLFLDKVMDTPFAKGLVIPSENDPIARKQFWDNTISVTTGIDSSILNIRAYSENPNDPERYVEAVSNVFLTSGQEFHGANGLVSVKLVDGPVSFKQSTLTSAASKLVLGLVLGCVVGLLIALVFGVWSKQVFLSDSSFVAQSASSGSSSRASEASREISQGSEYNEISPRARNSLGRNDNSQIATEMTSDAKIQATTSASRPEYQLNKQSGPVLRTVFDDLEKLGLDPAKLTIEA